MGRTNKTSVKKTNKVFEAINRKGIEKVIVENVEVLDYEVVNIGIEEEDEVLF